MWKNTHTQKKTNGGNDPLAEDYGKIRKRRKIKTKQ